MKRFSYEYEDLLKNATFTEPYTTFPLSLEDLESNGITEQKIEKLFYGICRKQGLPPYDFMDESVEDLIDDEGEEYVANIHMIRKSKDGKFIKFPVVYWISNVISDIENNKEKTENPELITKNLDANNFITLNGLTGDFTYNKVTGKMSTGSRKFILLRALLHSKTNSITYDELARLLFKETERYSSALHREGLFEALGSLKEDLGILPIKDRKNMDCFENDNQTYRLAYPR